MYHLFAGGMYYLGSGVHEVIVKSPIKDGLTLLAIVTFLGALVGCAILFVVFDVPSAIKKLL